ncbi:DUF305 domain-containing protein [Actinocorallia sp. API 0066]|uniref:DUF305 domain-containing protein n=1 Tax=Actinocorallia sp. API 0066 TaxID=2896846 RepID=UPI001E2BE683|nr:DUF305 domain-containing protein [Actinocorallia sp. API 0066]MCD0449792.1 DUF305 domain-containing protein [Actinocorallia sp. API 0066]
MTVGGVPRAVAFAVLGAVAALLLGGALPVGDDDAGGRAEIGFARDMIVHHEQAVTMAQAVLGRDVSPSVAQVAAGVQLNQLREIGQMEGWLGLWGAPLIGADPPMAWTSGAHRHTPDGAMPGLATLDEIAELGELEGAALEKRFLQLMIRHHEGGRAMAAEAAHLARVPHVRSQAARMATAQTRELTTMTGLLAALGATPLPA